jgi:hypothetical protein
MNPILLRLCLNRWGFNIGLTGFLKLDQNLFEIVSHLVADILFD